MTQRKTTVQKRILDARHVRSFAGGFSWVDRRFVRDGWIDHLTLEESALYFFLAAVSDKDGLSFYAHGRIATTLKLNREQLSTARFRLVELGLVAWDPPLYQVLEIPQSMAEGRLRGAP